jgi:hypothetical protein
MKFASTKKHCMQHKLISPLATIFIAAIILVAMFIAKLMNKEAV